MAQTVCNGCEESIPLEDGWHIYKNGLELYGNYMSETHVKMLCKRVQNPVLNTYEIPNQTRVDS